MATEAGGRRGEVDRPGADVGDRAGHGAGALEQDRRGVQRGRVEPAVEPGAVVADREPEHQTRPVGRAALGCGRPPGGAGTGSPATSPAVVAMAERTSAADQSWRLSSAAATPLVRAAATDVPEPRSQRRAEVRRRGGAEDADGRRDDVGLDERARRVARAGPGDEASGVRCTPSGEPPQAGVAAIQDRGAVVLGQVDGRHAVEVGGGLATARVDEHHAHAVGPRTASDLSTRPMRPRSHTTMRPETSAASRLPGRQ